MSVNFLLYQRAADKNKLARSSAFKEDQEEVNIFKTPLLTPEAKQETSPVHFGNLVPSQYLFEFIVHKTLLWARKRA